MKKTGFTLLEVIIATLILALVIGSLANIFVVGKRHILYSRSKMQTAELGRLFLDPLQAQVRQDQWGNINHCLSTNAGCPAGAQTLDSIPYTPTYDITNVNVGVGNTLPLRKVKVTISWNESMP